MAQLEASGQAAVSGLESGGGKEVSSGRHSVTHPALIVLAVIGLVAALYFARGFFVPLLIGILASYTLRPMVGWLQAMRIPRAIAAAVVLGVLVGGVSWVGYSLSDEASVMLEKLPEAARKLRRNLDQNTWGQTPSKGQYFQTASLMF